MGVLIWIYLSRIGSHKVGKIITLFNFNYASVHARALLGIFQWGGQLQKEKKDGKVKKYKLWGGGGDSDHSQKLFWIFELFRLDFMQFQHDFCSFSDKKALLLEGQTIPGGLA